jgi:hypothetical protein
MNDFLGVLLNLINETLTAGIVVISASMLLYNLSRNLRNRVARTSGIVLASVTIVSLCDVLVSLGPSAKVLEAIVRVQWIGIAFVPAATIHLSDALLATTGLPSRGRRRRIIRLLYLISVVFIIAAAFSEILIHPILRGNQLINILGGSLFPVYTAYFLIGSAVAFVNVQRARQRCLTRNTRRRMGYLQLALLTPALGIFPYSVLLGLSETGSIGMLFLVNVANFVLIMMLLFLSYPLSFFGSRLPDRAVKADLLRFMLRGPATGLLALAVIIFTTPATRIIGLPGNTFMPFAVVATVLLWQWLVALSLPWLEKRLIYSGEDDDQLAKIQNLSERLLTRADLLQLFEAILASTCDYLQVNTAFVVSLTEAAPEIISSVGPTRPNPKWLEEEQETLQSLLQMKSDDTPIQKWHSYWITPLYSRRTGNSNAIIGFLGIQARAMEVDLTPDERLVFRGQVRRVGQTLDDLTLQTEIYAALEGLLPQITITRTRAAEVEFRPGREPSKVPENGTIDREQFTEQVRAALRHYWGGPGLTSSGLQGLTIVQDVMKDNDGNPARALRAILLKAIEKQRPEGERKLLSPEWTIYNILIERFIERHKVRDVAPRLALSEPDLFRKQRVAIEAVADTLIDMESSASHS